MAKKFSGLEARMSPEARAQAQALYVQHLQEMPLHELRKAQALSQETLAKALNINQAAVRKPAAIQSCRLKKNLFRVRSPVIRSQIPPSEHVKPAYNPDGPNGQIITVVAGFRQLGCPCHLQDFQTF